MIIFDSFCSCDFFFQNPFAINENQMKQTDIMPFDAPELDWLIRLTCICERLSAIILCSCHGNLT